MMDIETYLKQGWTRANSVTLDLVVIKSAPRVSVIANLEPSFLYQFFHLLSDLGPRIHQCRGCHR